MEQKSWNYIRQISSEDGTQKLEYIEWEDNSYSIILEFADRRLVFDYTNSVTAMAHYGLHKSVMLGGRL